MITFQSLGLSKEVLQGVVDSGYTSPTPIQAEAIPIAAAGRDLIGCAQTGTGKTAAFVLPVLHRLAQTSTGRGPRPVRALVVTPTRELALQVEESVRTYGTATRLYSHAIFGGVGMGPQLQALRRGVDIVVATPGRLLDHMERGSIDLSRLEILILDEADRMFDMGFIRDIRKIVAATPRNRQTLLFSATMPPAIQELAENVLTDPQKVEIGHRRNPAETVTQRVCPIPQDQKMDLLFHLLQTEPLENIIIFSRTKHRADRVMRKLVQRGFKATVIHSNRSQGQRQRALEGFKDGKFNILVATDIAARGIDVDGISHVINFDTPNQAEDYIHRIGRTGRANAQGDAITFVARDEEAYVKTIERHMGHRIARETYDGFARESASEVATAEARPERDGGRPNNNRSRRNTPRSTSSSRRSR